MTVLTNDPENYLRTTIAGAFWLAIEIVNYAKRELLISTYDRERERKKERMIYLFQQETK